MARSFQKQFFAAVVILNFSVARASEKSFFPACNHVHQRIEAGGDLCDSSDNGISSAIEMASIPVKDVRQLLEFEKRVKDAAQSEIEGQLAARRRLLSCVENPFQLDSDCHRKIAGMKSQIAFYVEKTRLALAFSVPRVPEDHSLNPRIQMPALMGGKV